MPTCCEALATVQKAEQPVFEHPNVCMLVVYLDAGGMLHHKTKHACHLNEISSFLPFADTCHRWKLPPPLLTRSVSAMSAMPKHRYMRLENCQKVAGAARRSH